MHSVLNQITLPTDITIISILNYLVLILMEFSKIHFVIIFLMIIEDPVDGSEGDCHTCAVHEKCAQKLHEDEDAGRVSER